MEMFALVVSAQYGKIAERFLGRLPTAEGLALLGPDDPALRVTRDEAFAKFAAHGCACKYTKVLLSSVALPCDAGSVADGSFDICSAADARTRQRS